jgi:phenylpyruvate tautomerase PptA (4-oxalocrotonate tautomerase family)
MPILDVELVCVSEAEFRSASAAAIANAVGKALNCEPGRVWVRLRRLERDCYAENEVSLSKEELPVFVTVLHAHLPAEQALGAEAVVLTEAVARAVGRRAERVHVQYAPAGAGRQAFGGVLVKAGA